METNGVSQKNTADAQQKLKLNTPTKAVRESTAVAPADKSKEAPAAETIVISPEAKALDDASKQLAKEMEVAESDKNAYETATLKRIRDDIENGTFPVDAERVAQKLLSLEYGLEVGPTKS